MSKTTIVQDVLDVFRAAGFEVRVSEFGDKPEIIIYGTSDNAGILMESVCEHFSSSTEAGFSCAQRGNEEGIAPLTAPAPLTDELPELPVPLEIDWPQLHSQALGCGVEDRSIHDRYEAAEYGWQVGMEAAAECVPELIYDEEAVLAIQREAYELGRDKAAPAPQQSMLTDERIEELFMPMMPWLPSKHGLQQFARVIEREVAKAAPAAPVQTAEPKRIPDMLTVETIQGAIAFGRMGINPPPSPDHWGNEFWQIGRQLAKLSETSAWDNVTPVDVAAPVQADQAQAEPVAYMGGYGNVYSARTHGGPICTTDRPLYGAAPAQAEQAAAVRAAEWISVEDRLPDLHVTVALLDENRWMNTGSSDHNVNWHGAGYLCEFGQKYWSIFGEMRSQCMEAVTHWMPIPAAPSTATSNDTAAKQSDNGESHE